MIFMYYFLFIFIFFDFHFFIYFHFLFAVLIFIPFHFLFVVFISFHFFTFPAFSFSWKPLPIQTAYMSTHYLVLSNLIHSGISNFIYWLWKTSCLLINSSVESFQTSAWNFLTPWPSSGRMVPDAVGCVRNARHHWLHWRCRRHLWLGHGTWADVRLARPDKSRNQYTTVIDRHASILR